MALSSSEMVTGVGTPDTHNFTGLAGELQVSGPAVSPTSVVTNDPLVYTTVPISEEKIIIMI